MNTSIWLFKDGDSMGIMIAWQFKEDIPDKVLMLREFNKKFYELLAEVIESGCFACDWNFQLSIWLPQFIDLNKRINNLNLDYFFTSQFNHTSLRMYEGDCINTTIVASYIDNINVHLNRDNPRENEYKSKIRELERKVLEKNTKIIELESILAREK